MPYTEDSCIILTDSMLQDEMQLPPQDCISAYLNSSLGCLSHGTKWFERE